MQFKTLYSDSNQDTVVLVQSGTHRSRNGKENPEMNPHKYFQVILTLAKNNFFFQYRNKSNDGDPLDIHRPNKNSNKMSK